MNCGSLAAVDQALRRDVEERQKRAIHRVIEQRIALLTPRERQVMERVVYGRLNKQIAAEFGIGEKCVKVHRGRVMLKMGARSVAELVQLAYPMGFVLDPPLRTLAVTSDGAPGARVDTQRARLRQIHA